MQGKETMSELDFKHLINESVNIVNFGLTDSIFDHKYGLTEADVVYLIYILVSKCIIRKSELKGLLELDDITFESIYKLCC